MTYNVNRSGLAIVWLAGFLGSAVYSSGVQAQSPTRAQSPGQTLSETRAPDTPSYTGGTLSNVDYHHGQLRPAVGVHNIQVFRADRSRPDTRGLNWTYNHGPTLAHWQDRFYLAYLSNPVGEHIPPGATFLMHSRDGRDWSEPEVLFPPYKIPDGTVKDGHPGKAKDLYAVMHQRMNFYVAKSGRLLALGYYGISFDPKDSPNDGKGIGRVVRELYADGTFGPIYFIRYNQGREAENTQWPFYKKSKDKEFVAACDELLGNPLMMQQWVEEADRDDPLIPLKEQYKAFSYYHLPDGRVVGWWKHALTSISGDGGRTWNYAPVRAPGFVNGNAKIWGQKTTDGRYATVYNPSEFRWPLAVSTSEDGIEFQDLYLVNGEITPMRYGGNYKSYGPQYVRGIPEGNGMPPDGKLWVSYSMNKEDIWVASIPVPVSAEAPAHANEVFAEMPAGRELERWNIFSPLLAPVRIGKLEDGRKGLLLRDSDRFDYAKAVRVFPSEEKLSAEFSLVPLQNNRGLLHIEFQDAEGTPAVRLLFDSDSVFKTKAGYRLSGIMEYEADRQYDIKVTLDAPRRYYEVFVNGKKKKSGIFFAPVDSLERIVFRTGEVRRFPDTDTPTDQSYDLPGADRPAEPAGFYIRSLKTAGAAGAAGAAGGQAAPAVRKPAPAVLNPADYRHHVAYFNAMEDENISQAIPNAAAWDWMKQNIPLFECPQDNFQEIYYYRWWTLRKHLRETPAGYAFTEFLVERSYADKYNLISCALGHHIYEARWLHDQEYLDDYVHVWYRGEKGGPMPRLHAFSSWTADALYNRFLVNKDADFLSNMLPDLIDEFKYWEAERGRPDGLFWQYDVRDGMEESISGGRHEKNARPTINSYMYGNARAIAAIAELANKNGIRREYLNKAVRIRNLINDKLWNSDSSFYETVTEAGKWAGVREAIGYLPWYFDIPGSEHASAWKQVSDPRGFLAPYGLTTAERRHPEFRTHGCCNCEWDGAVWPFATSQTLTAMARLLEDKTQSIVSDSLYFRLLETYVESQYHRGRPYIGEYLDETTGYWLKGDQERSRYYNHSTFNDLIITGLAGLRPRADDTVEVNPLLPPGTWDWFCLDNVPYHGKILTILWDKTGEKYNRGKGFQVLVDGKQIAWSENLERLTGFIN